MYKKSIFAKQLIETMADYPKKLFRYDKNYILKEAQLASKEVLLLSMVQNVKDYYLQFYNPLGLQDDAIIKISSCSKFDLTCFEDFYKCLSGIYRYRFGDNQLEIIFDGRGHFEYYQENWENAFNNWISQFLKFDNFIKAVLEASIFYSGDYKAVLANNRLKLFLNNYFGIKVYKYKGIVEMKIA